MGLNKKCQATVEKVVDSFMAHYLEIRTKRKSFDDAIMSVCKVLYEEITTRWNDLSIFDRGRQWSHIVDVDVVKLEAAISESDKIALGICALLPMACGGESCDEDASERYAAEYLVTKYKKGQLDHLLKLLEVRRKLK